MEIQKLHSIYLNSSGVTTDSRKIETGQLFFALKGDNFNGNKYANVAIEKGASYAIVDEAEFAKNEKFILVKNVLSALQELAKYHRKYLKIPILAITGTNGKTTTKELISRILQQKFNLGYTKGNFNNHIGVPLTLLSFTKETEMGVVEMGANHQGEIDELCGIADPDFGIITNIGKAHIEGFGSFEGVIKTKSELYVYLRKKNGTVFINGEDNLLLKQAINLTKITYGKSSKQNTFAEFIGSSPFLKIKWGENLITTRLVGEYNFNNILAGISVGSYFKIPTNKIISALEEYQPQNNRSQLKKTNKNTLIIDAYNANPTSMELAIKNFLNIKEDKKALILGDMFELGKSGKEEHLKVIELVTKLGFNKAFFIGDNFYQFSNSFGQYHFFTDTLSLCNFFKSKELLNFTILLKASRGIKLEQVIEYL